MSQKREGRSRPDPRHNAVVARQEEGIHSTHVRLEDLAPFLPARCGSGAGSELGASIGCFRQDSCCWLFPFAISQRKSLGVLLTIHLSGAGDPNAKRGNQCRAGA